eukprot:2425388-Amphidinium_carterae.2
MVEEKGMAQAMLQNSVTTRLQHHTMHRQAIDGHDRNPPKGTSLGKRCRTALRKAYLSTMLKALLTSIATRT